VFKLSFDITRAKNFSVIRGLSLLLSVVVCVAQYIVHSKPNGVVALQNKKNHKFWLALKENAVIGTVSGVQLNNSEVIMCSFGSMLKSCIILTSSQGQGGIFCHFNVIDHGKLYILQ